MQAIALFSARTNRDDVSPLTSFLERFPDSAWAVSLRTELGCEYDRTGWYSKAIASWEGVWRSRESVGPTEALFAVHRAGSHLAHLYARLGRMSELYELLPQLDRIGLIGGDAQRVRSAKDGLWSMEHTPEIAFRCGPLALNRIRSRDDPTQGYQAAMVNSKSTTKGMSLFEVAGLSAELGMNYQMAFRAPGAELILPAVVHWKVGHYAALIRERGGLCLTQDPTFGDDAWISEAALEHEVSGYFLVRAGPLPPGWRPVGDGEGMKVFGKGATSSSNPDATSEFDDKVPCHESNRSASGGGASHGMPSWNVHLMLVSQEIVDTPVGYQPPFGPPIFTTLRFAQMQNERYSDRNHWSHTWQGMLYDDVLAPLSSVYLKSGGGWLAFIPDQTDTNIFHCQTHNAGILMRASPTNYVWQFPDGTKRLYSTVYASNSGTFRYVPMIGIEDAAGNHVSIGVNADQSYRVETVTDALGQVTHFYYELPDDGGPPPDPSYLGGGSDYNLMVTRIVDPFGRTASFQYGMILRIFQVSCSGGQSCPVHYYGHNLTNITDVAGFSSQLSYVGSDYVGAMTTPYGTTTFSWSSPRARNVVMEIIDPQGNKERVEYSEDQNVNVPAAEVFSTVPLGMATGNRFLYARNSYYWDKNAYAKGFATNDYSKATIYHYTHDTSLTATSGLLESSKKPLQNRVWYNYPGQAQPIVPGTGDLPVKIGRVLDDGTTQLEQYERNSLGNVTRSIDPVGRTLSYVYATNDVDLLEIRQIRAGNNELLMQAAYDTRHLPLTVRNAAGQTNRYSYNGRGQLLSITNAKNGSFVLTYDANGQLAAVDGPLPGAQDQSTFTYDSVGRLRTATDQSGYTLTVDYDDLDRITKVTYPDGTFTQMIFDRFKPGVVRDRLGRQTLFTYNSLRQLTATQDPLGHVTRFDWCGCGSLESIIDPLGRMTHWRHDIEGRTVAKEYADGSKVYFEYEHSTSRLRQMRDEQNQLTQFIYNADDTLREQRSVQPLLPTPSVTFTYDPDYLRLASMTDGNGPTTYRYEPVTATPTLAAGQLIAVDGPWANDTITFTYDELGRAVSRAINGVAVRRTYDEAGRLTQITNALGVFNYGWFGGSGRLASMQFPNGQHTDYAYYPNAQDQLLQRITHRLSNNTVLSEFTYAYDPVGQITNWTRFQGGALKTWAAQYDAAERLLGVAETASPGSPRSYVYNYDAADNRTLDQTNIVRSEFAYGPLNQLITISNSPPAEVAYEWDARNRLTAISNGTHRTEFSYDGLDRRTRIIEKDGAVTNDHRYVWSGAELCEERDATGANVLKRFFGRGVRAESGADLPAGNYFFTRDHLQSVREMTDSGGSLRAQYDYSPFGVRQVLGGDLEAGFGFTGHHRHQPSALNLTLYRAYDPNLGRWLSRDPMGEESDLNLYAYAYNDPLRQSDALGLDSAINVSISFYAGIGGGVSISYNPETGATSGGFEVGIGVGASIDVDSAGEAPFGEVQTGPAIGNEKGVWFNEESKASLFAEGGLVAGPLRTSLGGELEESPCQNGEFDEFKNDSKGCFGPYCINGKNGAVTGRADPAATKSLGHFLGTTSGHKPFELERKVGVKFSAPIYQPIKRD